MSRAEFETSVMSRALSAGKGRGSGPVLTMTVSPTRTSKTPRRGRSALMLTCSGVSVPSSAASIPPAIFFARVLKTDHCLHASISTAGKASTAASTGGAG